MGNMLESKVAVITGSGRGIGRAAAIMFAKEGAKVVVSDIDSEPAEETVADVRDLVERTDSQHGRYNFFEFDSA